MRGRDLLRDKRRSAALAGFAVALSAASVGCGSVAKMQDGSAAGGAMADGSTGTGGATAAGGATGAGGTGGAAGTGGSAATGGATGSGGATGTGGAIGNDAATDAPSVTDAPGDATTDTGPRDAPAADAGPRCDQPVSAGDCTGTIPRSCQELFTWGARTDGAYKIDPDGPTGANAPFATYCEMNVRDQTGWTLMAKVHTANVDSVNEQRTWFLTEASPAMLTTRAFIDNQPPAAHGAYKFAPLVTSSSVARFEIYAQLDVTEKATWYKAVASGASLQSWFTANDTVASKVCTDLAFTLNCTNGTIAPNGDATILNGMVLTPFGYTAGTCAIHMRLNDDVQPNFSGVCSCTSDNDSNKWKDSYGTHWGNGLLIWLN